MTCPVCRKESVKEYKPFCSRRCADIDLARWLRGDYRVPSDAAPDDAENPPNPLDTPRRLS